MRFYACGFCSVKMCKNGCGCRFHILKTWRKALTPKFSASIIDVVIVAANGSDILHDHLYYLSHQLHVLHCSTPNVPSLTSFDTSCYNTTSCSSFAHNLIPLLEKSPTLTFIQPLLENLAQLLEKSPPLTASYNQERNIIIPKTTLSYHHHHHSTSAKITITHHL